MRHPSHPIVKAEAVLERLWLSMASAIDDDIADDIAEIDALIERVEFIEERVLRAPWLGRETRRGLVALDRATNALENKIAECK
jgi:hypothetical protein